MKVAVCDRCKATAQLNALVTGQLVLPYGWEELLGKELCKKCMDALGNFLKLLPEERQAATANYEYTVGRHVAKETEAAVEQATRDWKERAEKAETELACCRIAALGWDQNPMKQGDRYWSAPYQDVLDLRRKWESQVTELATMREQLAHLEGIDKVCDHAHETILKMQIELDAREKVIEAVQKLLSEIRERYDVYVRKGENSPAQWVYGWCSIELESALASKQPANNIDHEYANRQKPLDKSAAEEEKR